MSDFYSTVSSFRAYHTARGVATSQHQDSAVLSALLVASECLDGRYRDNFAGLKVGARAQVREWPRTGVVDREGNSVSSESVPIEIENATNELAYKHLDNPGVLFVDISPNKYKSASVAGAVSVTYNSFGSTYDAQNKFAVIDAILSSLLNDMGDSSLSGSTCRG